jgi:hypothetical protein
LTWILPVLSGLSALVFGFDRLEERLAASVREGFHLGAGPDGAPLGSQLPAFRRSHLKGIITALEDYAAGTHRQARLVGGRGALSTRGFC